MCTVHGIYISVQAHSHKKIVTINTKEDNTKDNKRKCKKTNKHINETRVSINCNVSNKQNIKIQNLLRIVSEGI